VGGDAARPDGGKGIVRYRATRPNPKARERASVIPTTVRNLEAAEWRRTIRKLAKALDVEPRELGRGLTLFIGLESAANGRAFGLVMRNRYVVWFSQNK
jgi:hypothetical protein